MGDMDEEEYEDVVDDGYYDEIPGEFTSLCITDDDNDTPVKANFIEKDKLNVIPNVGLLRVTPRKIRDTTNPEKQKKEGWINSSIKAINLVKWSKKFEDRLAINILGSTLSNLNPAKFDPEEYVPGKYTEIEDPDIPDTVEHLFLEKQTIPESLSSSVEAGVVLPPTVYASNTYDTELQKIHPEYIELIDKVVPFCVMKLSSNKLLPKKEVTIYRLAIDAKMGLADINDPKTNEVEQCIVPLMCKGVVDFVTTKDYNKIKQRYKENVERRDSSK